MSYKYYVSKRSPYSNWMLDDTVPFFDATGNGAVADKVTGSADPSQAAAVVSCAEFSSVFSSASVAKFAFSLFQQGMEKRPFALEVWAMPIQRTAGSTGPQQILSHTGFFDGLSINGTTISFTTQYLTAGSATCEYDLQEYTGFHAVGVHNKDQNQLWVNGKLVASVDLTDAQKADTYIATDAYLYSGYTTSAQAIAMNGVSVYQNLTGEQIVQNYQAGLIAVKQSRVATQFRGVVFSMAGVAGNKYIERVWAVQKEFERGLKNNVEYSPTQITPAYVSGVSVAGTWTGAMPIDGLSYTSIYGVMVEWTGKDITVDVSVDSVTWVSAVSGELISIITSGYNPFGKDLQIRVSFAGGLVDDPAYLDSIHAVAFKDNTFQNVSTRPVTVSYPAVLRDDYEPNLYNDTNGVSLHGGTLTIGTDTTSDPQIARTVEMWIKPISGTPTISVSGTNYRNGYADTTLPVGEWNLIHIVASADITTSMTVTGDCIVGQLVIYPTALAASDILHIYHSYTGIPVMRLTDDYDIGLNDGGIPANTYTHDWSITGGG